MLSIADGRALTRVLKSPIDDKVKQLLVLRRDQLGGDIEGQARIAIVEAGDSLGAVQVQLGFPAFSDPYFAPEWVQDHGFAYECAYILVDDGFAHVVLIPQTESIDPQLIQFCGTYRSEHA